MIHDPPVDRITNGYRRVTHLTLAEVRELRLRDDLGGADAAVTNDRVATLDEMLRAAAGQIVLNLDIRHAVHAEMIEAVTVADAQTRVLVKANAGIDSRPMGRPSPVRLAAVHSDAERRCGIAFDD